MDSYLQPLLNYGIRYLFFPFFKMRLLSFWEFPSWTGSRQRLESPPFDFFVDNSFLEGLLDFNSEELAMGINQELN